MGLISFEEQLVQSTRDHHLQRRWHAAFHLTMTVCMVNTGIIGLSFVPSWVPLPELFPSLAISPLVCAVGFFALYSILLDPIAGVLFGLFCSAWEKLVFGIVNYFVLGVISIVQLQRLVIGVHISCWILIIGRYAWMRWITSAHSRDASATAELWARFVIFSPFYFFLCLLFVLGYRPALQSRISMAQTSKLHRS
jgi:hypothetical protein